MSGGIVIIEHRRRTGEASCSPRTTPARTAASAIEELTPRMFSFNNPFGACPTCTGLGSQLMKIDPDLVIPNKNLSILDGRHSRLAAGTASRRTASPGCTLRRWPRTMASTLDTTRWRTCPRRSMDVILYGTKGEKLEHALRPAHGAGAPWTSPLRASSTTWSAATGRPSRDAMKREIEELHEPEPCPDCHGERLKKEALAVTVGGINIHRLLSQSRSGRGPGLPGYHLPS